MLFAVSLCFKVSNLPVLDFDVPVGLRLPNSPLALPKIALLLL